MGDVLPPLPQPPALSLSQGSADGVLYCLRALNGTSVWQYRTNVWVVASPTRVLSLVYFAALNGYVYAVWADTGAVRVSQSQSRVRTSLQGNLPQCSTVLRVMRSSDASFVAPVFVPRPSSLQLAWRYRTLGPVWASPASASDGSAVYVGSADRFLYRLDGSTGRLVWSRAMGVEVRIRSGMVTLHIITHSLSSGV